MTQRTQRSTPPPVQVANSEGFHAALKALNTRFVRYYPALAALFEPYAEAGKSVALEDGKRTRSNTFDADTAALLFVRAVDLSGTSTRPDLAGSDEFDKEDGEFALELGVSLHRFRTARRFLAADVNLLGHRILRLPNRNVYRPIWSRIQTFFFGTEIGMGWGQLPLVAALPAPATGPPGSETDDELANSVCVNSALGVAKKRTRSDEKTHSYKEDLYKDNLFKKEIVVGVAPARERSQTAMKWAFEMESWLWRIGIEPPVSHELALQLADTYADTRSAKEITDRLINALTSLQQIKSVVNPVGVLISKIRRDPMLIGKRYELETG